MVEMRVFGLTIDPQTKTPIVILREMDGDVVLPIWVGAMEAMAVSLVLNNERLREESPPVQPADAATDMVRKAGARKEVDMLNGLLSRHGSLPGEDDTTEDQKFRDLLRSLDPVSRRKM